LFLDVVLDNGKGSTSGRYQAVGTRPENGFPIEGAEVAGKFFANDARGIRLNGVHEFGRGDGWGCGDKEVAVVRFTIGL
jgi:hypothetical protein